MCGFHARVQVIHDSLTVHDSNTCTSEAAAANATSSQQQQQQQPDALSGYSGGPVFLVTDIKSTGDAKTNIATMPQAPFLYGVSIGICMSSAMSEPGGAGLGTVGWHEVSVLLSSIHRVLIGLHQGQGLRVLEQ
jgi:hypothetical protein